jgi:hypothetical protein
VAGPLRCVWVVAWVRARVVGGGWVGRWVRLRVDARAAHTRHTHDTHMWHLRFRCLALCLFILALASLDRCGATTLTCTRTLTHAHIRTRARALSLSLSLAVSSPFLTPFPRLSCALNTVLNCCFNTVLNCCSHSPPPSTLCSATALRCNRGWRQISGRGSLTPLPLSSPDFLTGGRLPGEAKMMRGL